VFIQKSGWTLPTLYKLLNELRELAALVRNLYLMDGRDISSRYSQGNTPQGDLELDSQGKAPTCCEDAARLCNKAFTSCVTDRYASPRAND
jgi:hypothetical protein